LRFLAPFSSADAAELTPDEILHRSKEAMKPPIRYRKISEGATTLVCQKVLSDGSAAIRIEVISPVRKVSLILGKSICEFYLDHGVGIDTSFLMQSVASQGAAMSANLGGNARGTSTVRTLVSEDGREFLEITTFYPPNIFTAIADGLPATMKKRSETIIPLETRTLIDRKTFQTVETRTVSQAGSTISLTEYRDIERPADLGDDLFLPPDGLELLKPQGTHEYVNMLRAIHSMPPPQAEARERAAVVRPKPLPMLPQRMGRPEIDPRTGRIIPTFPPLIPAFSPRVTRHYTQPYKLSELRFGNFVGDSKLDVLHSTGSEWLVWDHFSKTWNHLNSSSIPLSQLTFELPDVDAFPCLQLAYDAGRTGGSAPAILSGANEVAVAAFLAGRIPWSAIAGVVAEALTGGTGNVREVADVLDADRVARDRATHAVDRLGRAA
jgi:hypothetical protein